MIAEIVLVAATMGVVFVAIYAFMTGKDVDKS